MKKIFLLLILLCSISFSNAGGFLDLKWGASKEETQKYILDTFNETTTIVKDDVIKYTLNDNDIKFLNIPLKDVYFGFTPNNKLHTWIAETYNIQGDETNIKNMLKEKYNLIEKTENGENYLYSDDNKEVIQIDFYPDKIEFYFTDYNIWLKN